MIIKKIPIKSFGGIKKTIEYIATDKGNIADYHRQSLFQNVLSTELDDMAEQFKKNFKEYADKRNKTVANHIMLAYSPLDKDKLKIEQLDELAQEYMRKAFPNAIGFATHHIGKDHRHTHILVSGNNYMEKRSTRQDKQTLKEVWMYMLDHVERVHPNLTIGVNREAYGQRKFSEKEYYQKLRNPEVLLDKDKLSKAVQDLFRVSESTSHFKELLQESGYTTYDRKGRIQGVFGLFGGERKKLRFSRLGIQRTHLEELDKQQERLSELEELREGQDTEKELEIE